MRKSGNVRAGCWPRRFPCWRLALRVRGITVVAQHRGEAMTSTSALAMQQRIGNAIVAYAKYIGKMFWAERAFVLLPAPRKPPGDVGNFGGRVIADCDHGGGLAVSRAAISGLWLDAVRGDVAAGDWNCAGGAAGNGGPLCVHSVNRVVRDDGVGVGVKQRNVGTFLQRPRGLWLRLSHCAWRSYGDQHRLLARQRDVVFTRARSRSLCKYANRNQSWGRAGG